MPPAAEAPQPVVSSAIQMVGVTAGYRGAGDVLAGVTLDLAPGATAIVNGAPGAGKSTLLHVLRAALAPREGQVRLLGSEVGVLPQRVRAALKRRIGYVAQTPLLLDDESVFDNVATPLNLAAAPAERAAADVTDLLGYLGLTDLAGRKAGVLSHVQRRLVAAARAFVVRPDIVIADEPIAGLGADAAGRVLRLLSEMARQRAAVVIATQTPEQFSALPAGHWRLDAGRLIPAPA